MELKDPSDHFKICTVRNDLVLENNYAYFLPILGVTA